MSLVKIYEKNGWKTKKILFGLIKTKKNNQYKKVYILGVQIYKKHIIDPKSVIKNFIFDTAYSIWSVYGAEESLISHLRYLSLSYSNIKLLSNNLWYIYLSCLLVRNEYAQAKAFLDRLIQFNATEGLEHFLMASDFAVQNGIMNEKVEKAAFVFRKLMDNTNKEAFISYIKDKKIALVGGSGCELGKNKGAEIDSHDIVIRFANYPEDEKYFADYGEKTNVWVRQSSPDLIHKPDISNYKWVIWKEKLDFVKIRGDHLDIMYNYFVKYPEKLFFIDSKYYADLYKLTGIYRPTAGCILIWWLYNILGSLDNVDVYGFSFLSKDYNDTKHYFDNVCKVATNHDMNLEIDFLYKLYCEKEKINV